MPETNTVCTRPAVSVIVPARNEEACLGACLQSLVSQSIASQSIASQNLVARSSSDGATQKAVEIIVVDDHSTDRTREIARSFSAAGVRMIDAPALPVGWTGKNNAVSAGAKVATGQWLLFTDADTVHTPGSLTRSLEEANHHGAALLSYSPRQVVKSFWEQAIMPVIFAELAATYRPSQVSNPNSSDAAANGQYILIAREAYDAVGGHAAIANEILEDVALARAVKRSGRTIFFRYGADAVRTRMYRSFAQLREGWTKNLALLFSSPLRLAVLRILEFILIVSTFFIAVAALTRQRWVPAFLAAVLCVTLYTIFVARIRRAHFSWDANFLALFGLPLFSYLLIRSARAHARGTVAWKGRTYGEKASPTADWQPATDN
jgi:glycosyltransferase involved in cell wall biosynthesis